MATSNPLERMREQRAMKLLSALQDDLHAQMRLEKDDLGRNGDNKSTSERRKARISRLSDPHERERIWSRDQLPLYQGVAIRSLPKTRDFWREVDVLEWCKGELDAACTLLDLSVEGKKIELVARIQEWVHEPERLASREEQRLLELQQDAILASGRVFAFGSNSHGELGLSHRRTCDLPTEIETFRGVHITRVYSGFDANFAFARTDDGQVFAWGGAGRALFDAATMEPCQPRLHQQEPVEQRKDCADTGYFADNSDGGSTFLSPRLIPCLSNKRLVHLACGRTNGHVAMTSENGDCFTWGRGEYGELGTNFGGPGGKVITEDPKQVELLQNSRVARVSVGNTHTVAITDTGRLYAWGSCWSGQLGLGETKRAGVKDKHLQSCFPTPTLVELLQSKRIIQVSCGAVHTAVVSADGHLFTFGCGDGGRLGLGNNEDSFHPQLVRALEKNVVLDVNCGSWHTICIARERDEALATEVPRRVLGATFSTDSIGGFVYSFGSGLQGQLGLGEQKLAALPTCIPALRRVRCSVIATSSHHSCVLTSDGNLYTWGQNSSGCLGRKRVEFASTDVAEPGLVDRGSFQGYGVGPIVSIAAGHNFTLFATGPWEPREEPLKEHFQIRTAVNRHSKQM